MEEFGRQIAEREPLERRGAYGITINEDRLLVVEYNRRLYLPGGALQEGERPEQALRREVLEETGYEVARAAPIAQAVQYVASTEGYFKKVCAFFAIDVGERVRNFYSPGHSPEWIPMDDAVPAIAEDASAWAVRRYLQTHS